MTVLQGQDGTIDETHSVEIVVRVTAPYATVVFKLPREVGVLFPGGASQISVKTDAQGIARSGKLISTGKGGAFFVEVQSTSQGQTATAQVHETNASAGASATAPANARKSHKVIVLAIIAAGAGAAAAVLLSSKKGSGSSATGTTVSITAGTPTVGQPQ